MSIKLYNILLFILLILCLPLQYYNSLNIKLSKILFNSNIENKGFKKYNMQYRSNNFYISNNQSNYDIPSNNFCNDNWKNNNRHFRKFKDKIVQTMTIQIKIQIFIINIINSNIIILS